MIIKTLANVNITRINNTDLPITFKFSNERNHLIRFEKGDTRCSVVCKLRELADAILHDRELDT